MLERNGFSVRRRRSDHRGKDHRLPISGRIRRRRDRSRGVRYMVGIEFEHNSVPAVIARLVVRPASATEGRAVEVLGAVENQVAIRKITVRPVETPERPTVPMTITIIQIRENSPLVILATIVGSTIEGRAHIEQKSTRRIGAIGLTALKVVDSSHFPISESSIWRSQRIHHSPASASPSCRTVDVSPLVEGESAYWVYVAEGVEPMRLPTTVAVRRRLEYSVTGGGIDAPGIHSQPGSGQPT